MIFKYCRERIWRCMIKRNNIASSFMVNDLWVPTNIEDKYALLAEKFWSTSDYSLFGLKDYYRRKETALKEFAQKLGISGNGIDIGCGNGSFTKILSQFLDNVDAYDISSAMINEAISINNTGNINYIVSNLNQLNTFKVYDFVSCMGVLSTLPNDMDFMRLVEKFTQLIKKDGVLFLIDGVSKSKSIMVNHDNGFIATYRNISSYKLALKACGFNLIIEHELHSDSNCFNKLFAFTYKGY